MVNPLPTILPAGDSALLVSFDEQIDPEINRRVHALAARLSAAGINGLGEPVPGYATLLVQYDPLTIGYAALSEQILSCARLAGEESLPLGRLVEIPTHYGGSDGPDLVFVAGQHHLSAEEVIRIHSQAEYLVFMIGFTPGFAYLGVVDERIATPRLATPRSVVKAGSVGIAGSQTGLYPIESPGGWQIIGRTSLRLFDPALNQPCLLAPGDRVRFIPVGEEEFNDGQPNPVGSA